MTAGRGTTCECDMERCICGVMPGRSASPHECHAGCPHDTSPGAWSVSQSEACVACGHERRDHSLSWSRCARCNCSGMTSPARTVTPKDG